MNNPSAPETQPAVRHRWTLRQMLFAGGLALWFGSTLVQTRLGAIVSLWAVAVFIGGLVIVTIPTRTLTLAELLQPFCLGGATIGMAILAGWAFDAVFGSKEVALRSFGIPLIEEALKIAPVLWILWRWRRVRAHTLGATDVLLLAAVSGAAFNWTEEAFIIRNRGSWSILGQFPTTEIVSGGHFIAGHAIWTAIAGLSIGLALPLGGSKLKFLLIAASGWLWSVLDHGANNYSVRYSDTLNSMLQTITGNGYLSFYIFILGVGAALILDLCCIYLVLPQVSQVALPPFPSTWSAAKRAWRYLYVRRQFAYATARYKRENGLDRTREVVAAIGLEASFAGWRAGG